MQRLVAGETVSKVARDFGATRQSSWPSSAQYRGRKKALVDDQVVELRHRADAGEQKVTLARGFGISRETLYQ